MKERALKYIKWGVSVIPLRKDKRPAIQSWKEYQTRIPTENEIEKWWGGADQPLIGIVTGKVSDLAVVDVDVRHGGNKDLFPQNTTIVQTGNGGYHLYYKYADGINNSAGKLPGIDIRGEGGYVVAPPSVTDYVNEKTGQREGGEYKVIKSQSFSEFPKFVFEGKGKHFDIGSVVTGVNSGTRNSTAAQVIGSLVANNKYTPEIAWELACAWNDRNKPPLSEHELKTVFQSIMKRESLKDNRKKEELTRKGKFISFTDVLRLSMEELDKTDSKDCISLGYKWLDDKVTGLFPGELMIVGGETGVGKTSFVTNIIYKASKSGIKCAVFALEDRLLDYGIKAVYFELGKLRKEAGFQTNYPWNDYRKNTLNDPNYKSLRSKAVENLSNDNLYFVDIQEQMNIDILEALVEQATKDGYKLFLIDHLHYFDLLRSDSSKADYIEKIMIKIKTLQNKTGARILMVVHYKKLEGKKPTNDSFKDSISITQNANYVVNLWRDRSPDANKYETMIYLTKARNPNGEATLHMEYDPATNEYKEWHEDFSGAVKKEFNKVVTNH